MILLFPPCFPTNGLQVPACPAPPFGDPPPGACVLHTGSCSPFVAGPALPQLGGGGWRAALPVFEFCREKRAWRPRGHAPQRPRRRGPLGPASAPSLIGADLRGRAGGETPRQLRAPAAVSRAGAEQRAGQPGWRRREEAACPSRGRRRAGPTTCEASRAAPGSEARRGAGAR